MKEVSDESIHLMITSPPYFNAPFDYPDLFKDYAEFLQLVQDLSNDLYRVVAPGHYPDNIQESILIFQKGKFDYSYVRELSSERLEKSRIPVNDYNSEGWHLTVWNITNVLPLGQRLEKGIAAFPEEIPKRLIKLFSFHGETILDPFLGSGTTMKVAQELERNSWGYEINPRLERIIKQKMAVNNTSDSKVEFLFGRNTNRIHKSIQRRKISQSRLITK